MKTSFIAFFIIVAAIATSCKTSKTAVAGKYDDLFKKVEKIDDSIRVGDMIIRNAFKHQILAHKDGKFDSLVIKNKVYTPNKYVFDTCLSMIFGDANGKKFATPGIYDWNRNLLTDHDSLVRAKITVLDSVNLNSLFTKHLKAVQEITGHKGKGSWIVYFGPKDFQIFGGCDDNAMVLDMFGDEWNATGINKVFAHELEHLVYGSVLKNDVDKETALAAVIDEGLATYFTHIYLKQPREEALDGKYTQLLMDNEKLIYNTLKPYFYKTGGDACPLLRHTGRSNECDFVVNIKGMPNDVANNLGYFLGFRIIEMYVKNHGKDSWKDIYNMPLRQFFEESGYDKYIASKAK
jgi:hypothetical protein